MARFNDALTGILSGLENAPENLESELTAAYTDDLAEANDIAAARVSELQAERDAATQTAQAMKAKNFDLIQQIPATEPTTDNDSLDSEPDLYGDDYFGKD